MCAIHITSNIASDIASNNLNDFLLEITVRKHFRDGLACQKDEINHVNDRQNYEGLFRLKSTYFFWISWSSVFETIFGRQDIENDAAASNVGSSCFPMSVRVYSIRIGDSETIFLFIIPNFGY
jgi:hypothetical protein